MYFTITTLGCKVNQCESSSLAALLEESGFSPCPEGIMPDICILNSCAVTAESARKSRQALRRLIKDNPEAAIAVGGCWSQSAASEAEELGAHIVSGSADRRGFVGLICRYLDERERLVELAELSALRDFELLPAVPPQERTRAMLKVQDGCSNFCSYCIVPYTRGRIRSLPADIAAAEARQLSEQGVKELVLTGIELASYGRELGLKGSPLAELVEKISAEAPELRLRLGSLEPRCVTEEFCERLSRLDRLCAHFHLSLQSGCDNTLRRMNRKYDSARFLQSVELLRRYFPDCGITADVIVGFPGETEEDFRSSLEFCRSCGFSAMHVFPYSKRPGTPAAVMEGQLSAAVKKRRATELGAVRDELERSFLSSRIGTEMEVLLEADGSGYSRNYCRVRTGRCELQNTLVNVRISGLEKDCLIGQVIEITH